MAADGGVNVLSQWSFQLLVDTCSTVKMRFLELIMADAAEVSATAYGIVESVDVVGYVRGRHVPTGVDASLDPLLFKLLKKRSATALSQQFARLLTLGSRWLSLRKRRHASLPYWEP